LGAGQATGLERAQERRPERAVLAVADGEAEHLPAAVGADPGGDHDGLRGDPGALAVLRPADPGLAVGGVEEHVRKRRRGQVPVGERSDLGIQLGADPAHLRLRNSRVGTQRLDQIVDLAHRCARHVGLHHHREQRLIDPPPTLQQAREERADPQLRDRQLHIAGRGGQHSVTVAVALRGPAIGALVRAGADHRRGFGFDELLQDHLQRGTYHVLGVRHLQCVQDLEQGRLGQGHRVVLLRKFLGGFLRSLTRWPLNIREPHGTYTTTGDVTPIWPNRQSAGQRRSYAVEVINSICDCEVVVGRGRAVRGYAIARVRRVVSLTL